MDTKNTEIIHDMTKENIKQIIKQHHFPISCASLSLIELTRYNLHLPDSNFLNNHILTIII